MKTNWRILTELIAGISIVLSLIFVGLEIQQSSSVARAEAILSFTSSIAEHNRTVAENGELASLIFDASNGRISSMSEISDEQKAQLYTLYSSTMNLYYGLYSSVEENVLPNEYLSIIDDPYLDAPVFSEVWSIMRAQYGEGFRDFVEVRMAR